MKEMEGIGDRSFSRLFFASFILLLLLAVNSPENFVSEAAKLPDDEVNALKAIASKLVKKGWNSSVDPCLGVGGWATPDSDPSNKVTCNCTYENGTVCHLVSIILKGQNLRGVLPEELSNLTKLTTFDVSRNYINGTIPTSWGALPLVKLCLCLSSPSPFDEPR